MMGILLLITTGLLAQKRQITGKVLDPSGSPIPAATIKIKGTATGTSADFEGAFKLDVSDGNSLIISGIGYEPKEVKVGSSTSLTIQLNTDSRSLSEVVVTGTGTATSKKKLGIAIQSVSADKLPAAPTASIDQALIGKVPGAQISSISGNPGDPVNIVLRGINTVQNGTKPLILLDGAEIHSTDLNSLDLSNVERVEIAQGAASAALYGAQGANGVIQIFTKKGKKGQVAINYSSGYAVNEFLNNGNVHKSKMHPYLTDGSNNLIDPSGNVLAINSDGYLSGISYTYGGATRYGILDPRNTNSKPYNANLKYYDHFKQVFKTGSTMNNSINVSGGSDRSDFSITASNNRTVTAIMKNGVLDRSNLTANLGTELFKGFKIRSITQLVYTRNTMHPGLGGPGGIDYGRGNSLSSIGGVYSFLNTSPFFDLTAKLADGTYPNYQKADFVSINAGNPYYRQEYTDGLDNKVDVIQNFDANYKVNKFLELDVKYGINFRTENSRWTYYNQTTNLNQIALSAWINNYGNNTGEIDNWQYTNSFENFLPSAFIRTDFEKDFHLNLPIQTSTQIAFDYRKNKYSEFDTYGVGLPLVPPGRSQGLGGTFYHLRLPGQSADRDRGVGRRHRRIQKRLFLCLRRRLQALYLSPRGRTLPALFPRFLEGR
jgi:TonB-dependent SusC/RagA subfamily outer membrane receptor